MIPVRDLRSVLYATAILFAFAVIGIRGVFLWLEHRDSLVRAQASTQNLALIMEQYAKRTLETSDLLLSEMLAYARGKGGVGNLSESGETHRYLAELMRRSSGNDLFVIVDRDGNLVASSLGPAGDAVSFADRGWFKAHRAGADTFVGSALISRLTPDLVYTYSRRIADLNGELDGVAIVGLSPSFLQEVSRPDANSADVTLGIWGRDGRVIARTGLTQDQLGTPLSQTALFNERASQRTGTYRTSSVLEGTDSIVSFRRLERWPITVTASIPVATALATWTSGLYWSAIVTAVVFIAFSWLTWLGVRLSHRTEDTQRQLQHLNQELGQANENLSQALADKVMLLQEIHHRVKNNLQVTSSLLQMQARRFTDEHTRAAFQETQDRLRSIGLIHDILYRKDTGGKIDLQDYLGRLITELSATYGATARGITVDLEADPIAIDLDRGAPLALAVTEAIINAFKHAFEPGQGGRIAVSASRVDGQIEVAVRDTGKGVSGVSENDSSLGMKLIRAFATQLGGRFSITSEGGTVFRLVIPA